MINRYTANIVCVYITNAHLLCLYVDTLTICTDCERFTTLFLYVYLAGAKTWRSSCLKRHVYVSLVWKTQSRDNSIAICGSWNNLRWYALYGKACLISEQIFLCIFKLLNRKVYKVNMIIMCFTTSSTSLWIHVFHIFILGIIVTFKKAFLKDNK